MGAEPVAVLVAARNEAERIGPTVARLREQFPGAEVIVPLLMSSAAATPTMAKCDAF